MNKKILALVLIIVLIVSGFFLIGRLEKGPYKNNNLKISLEIPDSWKGKYETEDYENTLTFYHKRGEDLGVLFTIEKRIGELIEEEDILQAPVPERIIKKDMGYTYIGIFPSDVQYDPSDIDLSKEYIEMREDIDGVLESLEPLEKVYPRGKIGRIYGSNFFSLELEDGVEIEKSQDNPLGWDLFRDGRIGQIDLVGISESEEAGIYPLNEFITGEIPRKLRISLKEGEEDLMDKIVGSLIVKGETYTSKDLRDNLYEYLDGATILRGQLVDYSLEENIVTRISIGTDQGVKDLVTSYPSVSLLKDSKPQIYGIDGLYESTIEANPHIIGAKFEVFLDENNNVVGLIEVE